MVPNRYVTLPMRGREARLIALETDAPPGLLEIHHRLVTRLARAPRKNPSDGYLPHFTLLRFKPSARGFRLREDEVEPIATPIFRIDRIALMRSALSVHGADHAVIEEVMLA